MPVFGILPLEILTDILSRIPIKSLCRLKCASPSCKSLISSPHLAQTHLNRTNTHNPNRNLKIILVSTSRALYSIDFSDSNPAAKKLYFPSAVQHSDNWFQVFSPFNGLLLVSDKATREGIDSLCRASSNPVYWIVADVTMMVPREKVRQLG